VTVSEVKQALGAWSVRLREGTPREILDNLASFGHVAIVPGRVDVRTVGDNLLTDARYVGVLRGREDRGDETELFGVGMAFWLGDEDDKGDVFVDPVVAASATFADSVRLVLPVSVTEGTLHSIPSSGTFSNTFQYVTPRKALTYITDTYSTQTYPVSWRINGDGSVDAGRDVDLFVSDPVAMLVRKQSGRDPFVRGLAGKMSLGLDVEDLTTTVVLLAEGEGAATVTASASQSTPYLDLQGNPLVMIRLVSESETSAGNAQARATLQLNRFRNARPEVELSSDEYDITGDVAVGDVIGVFDPDAGFSDPAVEKFYKGVPINPVALKVVELTWPVPAGWTVAYRSSLDGTWLDLSDYYIPESGATYIKVGELGRSLTGISGEPVGTRPVADTSTPAAPGFTAVDSVAYQSQASNDTRAALYLSWNEPLNTDGSTVLDGDHYEIRIRATETFNYQITWGQAAGFQWNELNTWGRPLSNDAATADQWKTYFVGWNTEELTITELMVSAEYEVQIRAVDNATPPNQSGWSASTFHVTRTDTLAPNQPAPPVVAASRIAVQVIHTLGDAAGGDFNLARDLHHLEVHAGGPAFYPEESTHLGNMAATDSHLQGQIPVVGTFALENTEDVWVRVVAVDRFGNRSGASEAVQSSVLLIDSAHISDLTASKITAGTITAAILMGARIATALEGSRVELNSDGVVLYDANGQPVINITAAASGNFFSITDGTDSALCTIDSEGNGSFQEVSADDMIIDGESFLDDYYDPLPKGIVAYGEYTKAENGGVSTVSATGIGTANQTPFMELSFVAEAGRRYRVRFNSQVSSASVDEDFAFELRDGGDAAPTTSSTRLARAEIGSGSEAFAVDLYLEYLGEFTAGLHRLLWTFFGFDGVANIYLDNHSATMYIEDVGSSVLVPDTAVIHVAAAPAPPAVTTYTRTYSATWYQTYTSGGGQKSDTTANQGALGSGSDGNQRSLVGFDYNTIRNDLSGATISKITLTAYAEHWWYNSGGTAVIGTHNYTSKPSSWADSRVNQNRQTSSGWPRSAKRTVTLSNTIGNELKAGTSTGIAFGPGNSSDQIYYGKFTGSGSNRPSITITYTK
jgi:hypothetical protein